MQNTIALLPYIPLPILAGLAGIASLLLIVSLRAGLRGGSLRVLAFLILFIALLNPQLQQEERAEKTNIVFLVIDNSNSQILPARQEQMQTALHSLRSQFTNLPNFELREITFTQDISQRDTGTLLLSQLKTAASDLQPVRIAGAIILSDGRIHDSNALRSFPAPVHHMQTGRRDDWDRRIQLLNAPNFAIVDEKLKIKLRISDQGQRPTTAPQQVPLTIALDGQSIGTFNVPVNHDVELPLILNHAGQNIVQFQFPSAQGELTPRNNHAILQINGVRDRLRVLLVSGEPHAGARTWRNLLKSDPAVDLVHFTILRPPEKQDNTPSNELSLIAFPTKQLFLEKIDEFDLIIFDRYKRRGLVTPPYLESTVNYVKNGGAVLISAGEYFAGAESLFRTPLGQILPAEPNAQVIERGFYPRISALGLRHPVTQTFGNKTEIDPKKPPWGRWYKLVVTNTPNADVVMSGADDHPLLVLDRIEQGRVAMLLSDQAWLWSRGAEGGGPQQELLRRLAHWLMKEPELEEERLSAKANTNTLHITRQSLRDELEPLQIKKPDGSQQELNLTQGEQGQWHGEFIGTENGIYHLSQGDVQTIVALGQTQPLEFSQVIATPDILTPLRKQTAGGWFALQDIPTPGLRVIRPDRPSFGDDWLGVIDRKAYDVTALKQTPVLPAWGYLLLASVFSLLAWWQQGRQRKN